LQHPPDLIPEFVHKWERGAEIVIGLRLPTKKHTSVAKRAFSKLFYGMLRRMTKTQVIPNATDYRLLDRSVIEEFNRFTERNRLTRGLIDWLGFSPSFVYFHPPRRLHGKATYSYRKLFELAVSSFVSMSLVPLKLGGYVGVIITAISLPLGIFIFIEKYILHDPLGLMFSGPATLAVILMFLIGLVLIGQGLMALYIANIYGEVVNRPLYVVRRGRQSAVQVTEPSPDDESVSSQSQAEPSFGEVRDSSRHTRGQ
jgi:dolichol-phosphate mannosyltransferase